MNLAQFLEKELWSRPKAEQGILVANAVKMLLKEVIIPGERGGSKKCRKTKKTRA